MVLIRQAVREDCSKILHLIKELASFGDMTDQVKMTVERLEMDGFSPNPKFSCIVAEEDENLVGYVIYYPTYSTWEGPMMCMEDLYVTPSARHRGIGMKLWRAVTKNAIEQNCQRLQWTCLGWNQNAISMYERFGGENLTKAEGWNIFRMNRKSMESFVSVAADV